MLGSADELLFGLFPVLFFAVFLLVFGVILTTLLRNVRQWRRDNASPVLTVPAKITGKRTAVSGGRNAMATTRYYATFEVESGDRMELAMTGEQYALLAEDDLGRLTFQGSRYLGFERICTDQDVS